MYRILILFTLITLSSQAVSDSAIRPDGRGGYNVYDQPKYGTNSSLQTQQLLDFMNRPSISEQSNQRNLNNAYKLQQILQLKNQNDLMKQQLESQRQLQEMQRENELLQRELEGNSRKHYSEEKQHTSQREDPVHTSEDCMVNCQNLGHKPDYCHRMCDIDSPAY